MLDIASLFKATAKLVFVYIREAHPTDGWRLEDSLPSEVVNGGGICDVLYAPKTNEQRVAAAKRFRDEFLSEKVEAMDGVVTDDISILVDDIDNRLEAAFDARPEKIVVVRRGKVVFASGIGPFQYSPEQLRQFLDE